MFQLQIVGLPAIHPAHYLPLHSHTSRRSRRGRIGVRVVVEAASLETAAVAKMGAGLPLRGQAPPELADGLNRYIQPFLPIASLLGPRKRFAHKEVKHPPGLAGFNRIAIHTNCSGRAQSGRLAPARARSSRRWKPRPPPDGVASRTRGRLYVWLDRKNVLPGNGPFDISFAM
ncbi:MAG TPA: hypothetical protein VM120_07035 [Bryobacteraceae bacterium]|nr:hypothetical protein [Bryobacteraceae bacterium]